MRLVKTPLSRFLLLVWALLRRWNGTTCDLTKGRKAVSTDGDKITEGAEG